MTNETTEEKPQSEGKTTFALSKSTKAKLYAVFEKRRDENADEFINRICIDKQNPEVPPR